MKSAKAKQELPKQCEELLRHPTGALRETPATPREARLGAGEGAVGGESRKLWSLAEMERTGGEPDVVGHDAKTGEVTFFDCSAQSPKGRESLGYDREALDGRKKFPPKGCITEAAAASAPSCSARHSISR